MYRPARIVIPVPVCMQPRFLIDRCPGSRIPNRGAPGFLHAAGSPISCAARHAARLSGVIAPSGGSRWSRSGGYGSPRLIVNLKPVAHIATGVVHPPKTTLTLFTHHRVVSSSRQRLSGIYTPAPPGLPRPSSLLPAQLLRRALRWCAFACSAASVSCAPAWLGPYTVCIRLCAVWMVVSLSPPAYHVTSAFFASAIYPAELRSRFHIAYPPTAAQRVVPHTVPPPAFSPCCVRTQCTRRCWRRIRTGAVRSSFILMTPSGMRSVFSVSRPYL